jgi:hypothetical protein
LKPIACEVANALFQSLDNIVAVGARRAGVARGPQISWPWAIVPDPSSPEGTVRLAIREKLSKSRAKQLPETWLDLIGKTFADHAAGLSHIDVIKGISLSGKHWELVPTRADALAIAWTLQGSTRQVIADIPADHFESNDEFVFHEGDAPITPQFQILTGTRLVAANKKSQPEPAAAFDYTARFVSTALTNARLL